MSDDIFGLQRDMADFRAAVQRIGDASKAAGILWKDAQYNKLKESIVNLAKVSGEILKTGHACCDELAKFDKIAAEEY